MNITCLLKYNSLLIGMAPLFTLRYKHTRNAPCAECWIKRWTKIHHCLKKKKKVCNLQGLQGNSEANSWLRLKYKMSGHCYQNDSLQTWPINERVNDKAEWRKHCSCNNCKKETSKQQTSALKDSWFTGFNNHFFYKPQKQLLI